MSICHNRTTIVLRNFNPKNPVDASFMLNIEQVFEAGVFLSYMCPNKSLWDTSEITKSRSDIYVTDHGKLVMDYETSERPPIQVLKHAISNKGLWKRLEIHTLYANLEQGFAGEVYLDKKSSDIFKTKLPSNKLTPNLDFFIHEALGFSNAYTTHEYQMSESDIYNLDKTIACQNLLESLTISSANALTLPKMPPMMFVFRKNDILGGFDYKTTQANFELWYTPRDKWASKIKTIFASERDAEGFVFLYVCKSSKSKKQPDTLISVVSSKTSCSCYKRAIKRDVFSTTLVSPDTLDATFLKKLLQNFNTTNEEF